MNQKVEFSKSNYFVVLLVIITIFVFVSSVIAYDNTQIVGTNYCNVSDTYYEVALPHYGVKSSWVKITYGEKVAIVNVKDIGPQNIADDYWNSGTARDMFQNLAQWMPQAEWVKSSSHGGLPIGRQPTSHPNFIGMSDFYTNPDNGTNFYKDFTAGLRYGVLKKTPANVRSQPKALDVEENWGPISTNAGIDLSGGVWKHLGLSAWNNSDIRAIVKWEFTTEIPKPIVKDFSPADVTNNRQPTISAKVEDLLSGMDIGSVQLNGKTSVASVKMMVSPTPDAEPQEVSTTWTPAEGQTIAINTIIISYTPLTPLSDGTYKVRIIATNNAGQITEVLHQFKIDTSQPIKPPIKPPIPLPPGYPKVGIGGAGGLNLSKIEHGSVHGSVGASATDDKGLTSFVILIEISPDTYKMIYGISFLYYPIYYSYSFEAEGNKKYIAVVSDTDGNVNVVEFTLIIQNEECRGMINDHPDDSESVKSIVPEFTPTPIVFGNPVVVLMTNAGVPGYTWRMIGEVAKEDAIGFLLEFDAEYLAKTHPLLVISSGGLMGSEKSEIFKDRLKRYAENGGTIVCFTTQHGYEFSALPKGEEISGYGWSEDQSCQSKSSYIETKHVMFSGQNESILDVNIDGYFTKIPSDAKVLLRRTKNGAPALIEYSYGRGKVILGALYSDWAWSSGQLTETERILIRDIIAYAKNPSIPIKEFKPEEWIEVDVPVMNGAGVVADKVVIEVLDPKREIIEIKEYAVVINPFETRVIKYSGVNRRELGIYQIQYSLYSSGNVIQDKRLGERFAVRIDISVGEYKLGDFVMWVVSQAEQVAKGESAVFNIFVQNNTDRDFNKGMIAIGDHGNTTDILLDIDVGAKSTKSFIFQKTMYSFVTLQFALYPAGSRIGTSLYSGNIASAERGINVVEPEVNVDVIMDKRFYNKLESAKISLTITNLKNISYNAEIEIVVVDIDNRKMFGKDISINLSALGEYKEIIDFVIPNEAKSGICLNLMQYCIRNSNF